MKTPSEARKRSAIVFAVLLYESVEFGLKSRLPGKWHSERDPDAIDEGRSGSIIEFRLRKWPPRFRLSIHSDSGGSLVGYGVFRPPGMNRRSDDPGLREYLELRVSGRDTTTPVHWAWYRKVDEPLRDFSRPETLIEVERIRRGEKSEGYHAFRRASDDLAELAVALEDWYSEVSQTTS
jgi:hypothetical protein